LTITIDEFPEVGDKVFLHGEYGVILRIGENILQDYQFSYKVDNSERIRWHLTGDVVWNKELSLWAYRGYI
jgi:hypothetical protein